MKRYIQHEFLKISHFATCEWQHPVHNHNHFEIVFVHRGKGAHCLSGIHYPYKDKSIFLLGPSDFHHFEVEEETVFTFLKFSAIYLNGIGQTELHTRWNLDMDQLLTRLRRNDHPLLATEAEAERACRIVNFIVEEWKTSGEETNETIFFLIQALLSVMYRNITTAVLPGNKKHSEKISAILQYIHHHIYSPELVQLEHLATTFGYSRNYLGAFFKEQTGVPLRDYINEYKLHLVENRLNFSSLSLKEISHTLGFTDISHLNKFFKTHRGMSPSAFRKQLQKI
ncbi:AraC family transcriptional regulator [uncultured Chitinophaga sp.]|jgi:AraC-type DNA-binding domain-containing proteins|uniref:AraC family transcriptional regulator n=1 Tax=uncultured Chitinophaga sp. TaxID=339340 RepID=UPI0026073D9F|nr:AraC family transcriptional regulator [uncultured Chitinophaga sp.]